MIKLINRYKTNLLKDISITTNNYKTINYIVEIPKFTFPKN